MDTVKGIKDVDSALLSFEDAASKHAIASEQGDYKIADKNYDRITAIVNWLRSQNKIDYLLSFLNHPDIAIRIAAASYLLSTYENEAVKVLEEIKRGDSFFSYEAELTLEEWRKGNLKL